MPRGPGKKENCLRGPGKKENYNLDYARFGDSRFGDDDDDDENISPEQNKKSAETLELQDMLSKMPPELQEAYRLMAVARSSGSLDAQKRANELAIQAVARGDANVKRQFVQHLSKQDPAAAAKICAEMSKGDRADTAKLVEELNTPAAERETTSIDALKQEMEEGARRCAKQKEALETQMAEFEKLKRPEDFMKFIHQSGMSEQDVQRMMGGDEDHMKMCFNRAIEKSMGPEEAPEKTEATEKALQAVESLHTTLCGDLSELDLPEGTGVQKEVRKELRDEAPKPQVIIPMHRLQYQKDDAGKYVSVELKCSLPGVTAMSCVQLDVSERHVRLNTQAPAPLYVINAGPFPVLIDASRAAAKFSKRREELCITVPAKA